jgi:alkylation response protein AidB-like acyl-CoA dehydrogenase
VRQDSLWARREFFDDDHESFRNTVRLFLDEHVTPFAASWDAAGITPREPWVAAGGLGLLGLMVPESLGGAGAQDDFAFRMVAQEEFARVGATSFGAGISVHADIVLPYFANLATPEQAARWVPQLCDGSLIGAIAMTEPGAGSDLRGIRTTARKDGADWVLSGSKTFITNGINSDIIIVFAADSESTTSRPTYSLFVVEKDAEGFERGRKLDKIGMKGQDTAELFFDDVRVPHANLLGEHGRGLAHLMSHLPLERLSIAAAGCAGARAALSWTIDYVAQRHVFGKPLAALQNTQFAVAEMVTELDVTQEYVNQSVRRLDRGVLTSVDAAKAKWWATEMHKRTVDRCLQLFGGYGYMTEYQIARAYADVRVTTIYGGTTEIMKHIIARDVFDTAPKP